MKKQKRKGRGRIGFFAVLVMVLCMGMCFTSHAGTLYESPYVKFSPDDYAWTVKEPLPYSYYLEYFYKENVTPEYWYPSGERIETGIVSTLRELKEGEHYYDTKRMGEVPVKYWEVKHTPGGCIHDCLDDYWHGVPNVGVEGNGNPCHKGYYSGWFAYCADCNQQLTHSLVYMSRTAAASITSIDVDKGYYYSCPSCAHIDNSANHTFHDCKDISFNQYKVVYDKNDKGTDTVVGLMEASYHMYNNEDVYEGEQITPITRLSSNVYKRRGYEFAGWNTKPDGSGTHYEDCAEILNLSVYEHSIDPERGTVTLYAQWVESESTLQIDPNGGAYDGNTGITAITKGYGETYLVDNDKITPPLGCQVSYDLQGGMFKEDTENPVRIKNVFVSWQLSAPFHGYYADDTYYFEGANGSVDTLSAVYEGGSIILPDAQREGFSFGGWFEDAECTRPVGAGGDSYTPKTNVTLYAQWVNLVLDSEENYTDNDKKGAVNLFWKQEDSLAKSYKLYESTDGVNFTQILGATKDIDLEALSQDFDYKGVTQTYTVKYSGFYDLTAFGAQGGNYTKILDDGSALELKGGKGGKTFARVYLTAGEQLTVAVGGQGGSDGTNKGGFSGGGNGTQYGSGGGVTFMKSNLKGTLIMAGGGGGAGATGDGGKGGAWESLRSDKKTSGENGMAGGGAGHTGGTAGEHVVHNHVDECYLEKELSYAFTQFKENAEVSCDFYGYTPDNSSISTQIGVSAHTNGSSENRVYINIGTYNNPVPTKGNTMLSIPLHYYAWGGNPYIMEGAYLKVYSQSGQELANVDLSKDDMEGTQGVSKSYSIGSEETPKNYEIPLPKGTTGIYMALYIPVNHEGTGAWVSVGIGALSFMGGTEDVLNCIYEEGEVLYSKPGYGGSSYVNADYAVASSSSAGEREGAGFASIKAVSVGYMNTMSLKGVPAPDRAAPDKIDTDPEKITMKADGDSAVKLTFETPKDYGTQYWYKAESYKNGTDEKLCESNITTETLVTGVAGYYYILDTTPVKKVTARNADNKGKLLKNVGITNTVRVVLTEDIMYLHIAAVDVAGNIGSTADIKVEKADVAWAIATDQIAVTDVINGTDHGTVYQKDAKTFYVRANGTGPFQLSFRSFLDGAAREDYQIDYQIFDVALAEGKKQRYITRIPYSIPISSQEKLAVSEFVREMSGDSILQDAMNTGASRKRSAKDNDFYQAFTIPKSFHGKTLVVTPVAGSTFGEDIVYSEWSDDVNHSVTLIADGEAPVITGLELLENKNLINRNEEEITLTITATDELSGIRDFNVKIKNQDNFSSRTYYPDENNCICIEITKDEVLFSGDISVNAYAVDCVGNERVVSYGATEFGLTTDVKRILTPQEPIFKCGESGILTIKTWGYAERVEVEFPEEFTSRNPHLNQSFYYTESPLYEQTEALQFMVPLGVPMNQQYEIVIRAYKGEKMLDEQPLISTVEGGSVLEEIRTRLR